jgi:hypothetical protein
VYRGKMMFRKGIILRTHVNPQRNHFTNFKSHTGIKLLTPKKVWNKKLEGGLKDPTQREGSLQVHGS